jgi:hypothetical protein
VAKTPQPALKNPFSCCGVDHSAVFFLRRCSTSGFYQGNPAGMRLESPGASRTKCVLKESSLGVYSGSDQDHNIRENGKQNPFTAGM